MVQDPKGLIVMGDYVARDKYASDSGEFEAHLSEAIDLVPRVPQGYRGPIPLLAVYQDLPSDAFLFRYSTEKGVAYSAVRPAPPYPDDLLPLESSIHEVLTRISDPVVIVGSSGSGKTTALYRVAHDLLAAEFGVVSLLDGNGVFGADVARILNNKAPLGAANLGSIIGMPKALQRAGTTALSALLVDHIYTMNDELAEAAVGIINSVIDRYGPARIIMTERSAVAAEARGIRVQPKVVELAPLASDQIERLLQKYEPYLLNTALARIAPPDATNPGDALETPEAGYDDLKNVLKQVRAGLSPGPQHVLALERISSLFYIAIAQHPAPLTQARMIDVLCDGDLINNAAGAIEVASRLLALGLFIVGRDGTKSVHISDLSLAQKIAAVSPDAITSDVRGGLIDVASRRLNTTDEKDARKALNQFLSLPRNKGLTFSDIDDIQRRARLLISYLRIGRTVGADVRAKARKLQDTLLAISHDGRYPLRLRESVLREHVELSSLLGDMSGFIDFFWVPPGVAEFQLPRSSEIEHYKIDHGFYLAMRQTTEAQLWALRQALRIGAKQPSGRSLADPAGYVTWTEASQLAVSLSDLLQAFGLAAFLPSVPEWALARGSVSGVQSQIGNVVDTSTCLGHRSPLTLYAPDNLPYFGGGLLEWTRSAWGTDDLEDPRYLSPYRADDGREELNDQGMRLLRGSSWLFRENEILCSCVLPVEACFPDVGMRLALRPTTSNIDPHPYLRVDVTSSPVKVENYNAHGA